MRNQIKLGVCSALFIGSLVGVGDLAVYASSDDVIQQVTSPFQDVATNHYAYDAIVWGKNKGFINGYTDASGKSNGLFGPNDDVTEAQFVKMVSNYLELEETTENLMKNENQGVHWADSFYNTMAKYGVPLNGYFDNTIRNQPMKRGSVAQALGYLLGEKVELTDSIHFLLENGITTGQNPEFEGKDLNQFFGTTNHLTRGQVITFLYRMDHKKMNEVGTIANMTAEDSTSLNSKASEGTSNVDDALAGGSKTMKNNSHKDYSSFFENKGALTEEEVAAYNERMKSTNEREKYLAHYEVTDLSQTISNVVGKSEYGVDILGESSYKAVALKDNQSVYDFVIINDDYKKEISDFDFGYHALIMINKKHLNHFDLFKNDISNILKYQGLSESEALLVLNHIEKFIERENALKKEFQNEDYELNDYVEMFNKKVTITYYLAMIGIKFH